MVRSVTDLAPAWLRFIRADEWGIEWKRPPVAERLNDPETYIHQTAGSRWHTDPGEAMRRFQRWYHDVKNYSTIAYDVMVHRNTVDDTIAVCGAREGHLSAATKDRNDLGEAVCLFGYFNPGHRLSEHPTDREVEGLAFAVAWSIENGWSAADTRVLGHRDNPAHPNATDCPGAYLYPHLTRIHHRALELLAEAQRPPEVDPMLEFVKTHADDAAILLLNWADGSIRSAVDAAAIADVEALALAGNTAATARILTDHEWDHRGGLIWRGRLPEYGRRGPRTIRGDDFAQVID